MSTSIDHKPKRPLKRSREESPSFRESIYPFLMMEMGKLALLLKRFPLFILTGVGAGLIGYAFRGAIQWAGDWRKAEPFALFTLPLAGMVIFALYRSFHLEKKNGAKTVIAAVREGKRVSFYQLPLVFLASVLTHLAGGSAGREGGVLEMGGVLGDKAISLLKPKKNVVITEDERSVAILCGMSSAFSALFVTPLAAVFFVLEITDKRNLLHRFLPVLISSLIAFGVVCLLGWKPSRHPFYLPDPLPSAPFIKTAILAVACGLVGRVFCYLMRQTPIFFKKILKNGYLRAATGGTLILTLTVLLGTDKFNGLGSETIEAAFTGKASTLDFVWKMIFTAVTLGVGFKGGEIIPSFFVGGTFGVVAASGIGFLPDFGGALGVVAILAAVAKAPIAAFVLGIELFGAEGTFYFAVAAFFAYFVSGKRGLYSKDERPKI